MGPEGQAQKDDRNWTDEVPQGCVEEVQEWVQVGLFACPHHLSLVFVVIVFFLTPADQSSFQRKHGGEEEGQGYS